MIGLFYSTEDNSDSLSRNRWYIGNTLIAVLHLRHTLSLSAMLNAHVNMAAGCQGKEMVRLEFHAIFLFSAFMISFGNHVLWASSYLLLSYIAFSCIIPFSGPLLHLSGMEMAYVLLDFSLSHRELAAPCQTHYMPEPIMSWWQSPVPLEECIDWLPSSFSGGVQWITPFLQRQELR